MNVLLLPVVLLALSAAPAFAHEKKTPPAGVEGIDVYDQGETVDLLEGRQAGKVSELFHQRSVDGGKTWTKAQRINVPGLAAVAPIHPGSEAQIAAYKDLLVVVWTAAGSNKWGTGPLTVAVSSDAGKTWQGAPSPTDVAVPEGQSYIDLSADGAGAFHAVWLDSRDGGQGLRYARSSDPKRGWDKNETLVKRTCECCWNRIHSGSNGDVAILYRALDPRDMALYQKDSATTAWRDAGVVGAFGWKFDGCPHAGGALVSTEGPDSAMHAAIWTGAAGKVGLYHLRKTAGANGWSEPSRIGGESAKNPDLAAKNDAVAAVWDALVGSKRRVYGSLSRDGGKTWSPAKQLSSDAASSSHPRVVSSADGFVVFWTESASSQPTVWRQKNL